MEARCTHCHELANWAITYEDALGVMVEEAACHDCANARSGRTDFNKKSISGVTVDF